MNVVDRSGLIRLAQLTDGRSTDSITITGAGARVDTIRSPSCS
jgi:hypothetical protein